MEMILENVRSICGRRRIPLKPLTLLVGENSSGKTTFLAMVAHVLRGGFPSVRPSFSVPPFDLGTYDSIATYKGGKYGRAKTFSVGFAEEGEDGGREVVSTYANHRGQPSLVNLLARGEPGRIELSLDPESGVAKMRAGSPDGTDSQFVVEVDVQDASRAQEDIPIGFLLRMAPHLRRASDREQGSVAPPPWYLALLSLIRPTPRHALALAPARTKPKRTYDEFSAEFDPEGDHIPVILARLWAGGDVAREQRLFTALREFGVEGSLFSDIGVRPLGKRPNDPFQILVRQNGPAANLQDVGYGVSQALPLVVQTALAGRRSTLLLQQPEVHLHPRSQAALGSFFARMAGKDRQLIVETHSDYLLDRVRIEVSRGTIEPDDVLVLFFEKKGLETSIHRIRVDGSGNIVGAPPSYRRFFLDEEFSLFSRGGSSVPDNRR